MVGIIIVHCKCFGFKALAAALIFTWFERTIEYIYCFNPTSPSVRIRSNCMPWIWNQKRWSSIIIWATLMYTAQGTCHKCDNWRCNNQLINGHLWLTPRISIESYPFEITFNIPYTVFCTISDWPKYWYQIIA